MKKNLLERLIVTEKDDDYTMEGIVAGFVATGDAKEDGAMIALSTMAATINLQHDLFPRRKGTSVGEKDLKEYPKRMIKMMTSARHQRKKGW